MVVIQISQSTLSLLVMINASDIQLLFKRSGINAIAKKAYGKESPLTRLYV